ncbi:peptide/nickel transport system substrate-binding protein [Humitalea rosea]|uniref:Peptide/nickel transport system substrate-binding protein n=1 Tax=Humitalea rosea TaxID=990373 RepID=A0A2W7IJE4_9PROT|nr:ABC transporter substrate-binding protein [Humitalea rosea]PZW46818.1 peptide/nickel transport system substrate-binding protein [Humitalea rosea]
MTEASHVAGISRRGVLGAGAGLGVLAGSGWSGPALAAPGVLRAAITGYNVVNTLDPAAAALIPEFYVIWGLYNGLLKFDSQMQLVPELAESYRVTDDGALEFKLRSGVKFHDGSVLTADDVKFTLERLMDEATRSPNRSKVSALSAIEVPDPLTVRLRTAEPFAPLLTFLTNARTGTQILSRKAVQADPAGYGRKPIGTGAYRLRAWEPGQALKLSLFEDYFIPGRNRIPEIEIPLIAEESSGVTALMGKQIDLTSTAPFADIPTLERRPDIKVLKQPGLNTRFLQLNTRKPPFDDVHFRRAVSLAINRDVLVRIVLFGEGVATPALIPPSLTASYDATPKPLTTFNAERARAELAKSKYGAGTTGAILTWGSGWWKRFGEVVAAQVNQVLGTNLTVEVTEANTVFSRIRAGDYQAGTWGWLGMIDPDEYSYDLLHSSGWRNFAGYANPALDTLLIQARRELDPARRGALYKQSEHLWIEDMPVIPLFCSNVHNLLASNVTGFTQLPYSNFGDQFATMAIG